MKIIFLCVDGVLNDETTKHTCLTPDGFMGIDDRMLYRLSRIVWSTGARIVLIDFWKEELDDTLNPLSRDGKYLLRMFSEYGLKLYDKTDDDIADRAQAVYKWLGIHPEVTACVVLGCDSCEFDGSAGFDRGYILQDDDRKVCAHLASTNWRAGGLTDGIASKCIEYLNSLPVRQSE